MTTLSTSCACIKAYLSPTQCSGGHFVGWINVSNGLVEVWGTSCLKRSPASLPCEGYGYTLRVCGVLPFCIIMCVLISVTISVQVLSVWYCLVLHPPLSMSDLGLHDGCLIQVESEHRLWEFICIFICSGSGRICPLESRCHQKLQTGGTQDSRKDG